MQTDISPLKWESKQVAEFLSLLGFQNLEKGIIENSITGEILMHADHDLLRELNIYSVGMRIKILKSIYALKSKNNIPIEEYDYIPKSIRMEMEKDMIKNETKYKIMDNKFKENEQQVYKLVNDVKQINEEMRQFKDDIRAIKMVMSNVNNNSLSEISKVKSSSSVNLYALTNEPDNIRKPETIKVYSALEKQECETLYKSLKLTPDDTTETFLTEVLKKYQIKNDIALYRLSINSERYLENDEHPLEVLINFRAKGTEAQLFLRKINLKEEQRAKLNSMDLKAMPQINTIKENTEKAIVLLPYKKKKDNELSIEIGEVVELLERESIEKYRVQKKGGSIGFVPAECIVEKAEDEEMELYDTPQDGEIRKEYKKINAFEISLKKGDKVKIHAKFRNWMYVDSNKKQGWMPYNNIISSLIENRSLEEINKFDDDNELQKPYVDFNSSLGMLDNRKRDGSLNFIDDENTNQSFIMEGTNEKEKNVIESFFINENRNNENSSSLDDIPNTSISKLQKRKLPQIPQSSSLENIHLQQFLHDNETKEGNPNLSAIRTNMHMRSASTNDSLPSASLLYTKYLLPTHSRKNSSDSVTHHSEKENPLHTPISTNETEYNNIDARSKLNGLISNFPHEGESDAHKKNAPIPNKVNALSKQFQNL
ncbi:hypothetical protein LY90DRAFT_709177 [Neocallimastix californiae]|jgi:hypothetical protein|uniref:RA-domain-containing protein n=1 Tax=Neocallimastix californiae TaxID=1754190 RepID=A0A1Y1Z9J3_9FUNG|nr:hypothetical protein LY90DRAFT_709177 [Neocallimastix californiae]|eukprot:ORY06784.1 hypothetical protein LY90DRAFT_709177 [Neocallimastix californiae]